MNFISQHIATIIHKYDGSAPLSLYLKDYFKQHKNIGSRDRKAISEGVYIYYRSALFLDSQDDPIEIIKQGFILCDSTNTFLAQKLDIDAHTKLQDIYAPDVQ